MAFEALRVMAGWGLGTLTQLRPADGATSSEQQSVSMDALKAAVGEAYGIAAERISDAKQAALAEGKHFDVSAPVAKRRHLELGERAQVVATAELFLPTPATCSPTASRSYVMPMAIARAQTTRDSMLARAGHGDG